MPVSSLSSPTGASWRKSPHAMIYSSALVRMNGQNATPPVTLRMVCLDHVRSAQFGRLDRRIAHLPLILSVSISAHVIKAAPTFVDNHRGRRGPFISSACPLDHLHQIRYFSFTQSRANEAMERGTSNIPINQMTSRSYNFSDSHSSQPC
jgi:hypothetical protein